MWVDEGALKEVLMTDSGVFRSLLGFGTGTGVIKGVHIMNDLAQCVLGGAPEGAGDLLCRVIRGDKIEGGEDNSDALLREDITVGSDYRRAFPETLGTPEVTRLRDGVGALLSFDGGMYKAGDQMASGLATHLSLLGFDGFRRFGVGRYLSQVIGDAGQSRIGELFSTPTDPHTRAMAPLMIDQRLKDTHPPALHAQSLSAFDRSLGTALTTLISQPLTKPNLLRMFMLAASLGICLKLLGVGAPGGRPTTLATSADDVGPGRLLRQEAVQSFRRGLNNLNAAITEAAVSHPVWPQVLSPQQRQGRSSFESELDPEKVIAAARRSSDAIYWPDSFAIALGRKAGCVMPKRDHAGWGKHLVLTGDLIEALVLMFVPHGSEPIAWPELWDRIRDDLGLVIGADDFGDPHLLRAAGVLHVNAEDLAKNSDNMLAMAIRRGVARRLPDSGAEAGGALQ